MSNQLELRYIKYFLSVAKELHFRKAAELLYISQPGLSRQIKQMEDDLGIKLFERNNRKVKLTKAGEYLKKELSSHLKSLNDIINHAQLLAKGIDGKLKLAYVGSAMQQLIPRLLLKFRESSPNVLINLTEMDNRSQIQALFDMDIDIGFVRLERVPRGLKIQPATTESFSLVLPDNHPIDESNFENLRQFKNENFILFDASYSESYYEKVMQIFDDSGFYPNVLHSTVNAGSIYRLVENYFGISIVPTSLSYGYNFKIKFIELKNIQQRTALKIVWNRVNTNPVLLNFTEIIKKNINHIIPF